MLATGRERSDIRLDLTYDYFARRPFKPSRNYWAPRRDPDATLRYRMSDEERAQYFDDISEERTFIECLKPGTICDFGAGPGWLLQSLPDEWDKVAVEIDEQACDALRQAGIRCVASLAEVPIGSVSVVFAHHVIEHLEDPLEALRRIRCLLEPKGWLILGTPDFASPCAVRFDNNYRMLHDETHCSLFTNESMHRCLRDYGFEIQRVAYPFPDRYATIETFARWNDTNKVSPPWPGNWMTFYCTKSKGR